MIKFLSLQLSPLDPGAGLIYESKDAGKLALSLILEAFLLKVEIGVQPVATVV